MTWQQWVTVGFTLSMMVGIPSQAQIIPDNTLGTRVNELSGSNYQIDAGTRRGSNLFHSFQDFNLSSGQTATFMPPENLTININNVISRVTGGHPSEIDGTIRSTIPNADMYFLNPYGIIFKDNARLEVQGSFHASTADYLRLGDGGRFDASNPSASILNVAPIEAFGFLGNSVASISVEGRGEISADEWDNDNPTGLKVSEQRAKHSR